MSSSSKRLALPAQQVGTGERGDERVGRVVDELVGRRELAQLAVDQHADLTRECGGVLVVVRDENRRQRELAQQLLQLGAHRVLRVGVERGERLVEQDRAGLARERPREGDALALAARQRRRAGGGEVGDAEPLEILVGALPPA